MVTGEFKSKWVTPGFIVGLIIIGAIIRFYRLDWQCLMADEWHTWVFVTTHTLSQSFFNGILSPNNSLYYPFAKLFSSILNEVSIYSLRLPAAIFGILAIPVSYILGKEYKNEITGVLLSGFIALSFPFIYYSQNARSYSVVILAFLVFTLFLMRAIREEFNIVTMLGLSSGAILCLYAHPYAVIPVIISGAMVLYYNLDRVWLYAAATVAVVGPGFYYNRNYIPSVFSNSFHINYNSPFWISWDRFMAMIPSELFGAIWWVVIPMFTYSIYKTHDRVSTSFAIIGILTIISCIPMTLVLEMSPRYVLLVSPMLFLIAITPASDFIKKYEGDLKKIALILMCLFIFWAFAYWSWVSWTTFNICPLVTSYPVD